jgi:hypothetical protein
MSSGSGGSGRDQNLDLFRCRLDRALSIPAWGARLPGAPCRDAAAGELRGDGLLLVAAGDLDAAGLGRLVDRDG